MIDCFSSRVRPRVLILDRLATDSSTFTGAPDILLRRCTSYLDSNGHSARLDEKALDAITSIQQELASKGQRVLLLAQKIVKPYKLEIEVVDDEDSLVALNVDLTIVGLASMVDPLRDDTAETVRICRQAGIRFMMGALALFGAVIDPALTSLASQSPAT